MPVIRTSQIEDEYIYVPHHHLSRVRTNRRPTDRSRSYKTNSYQWVVFVLTIISMVTSFFLIIIGFFHTELSKFSPKNVNPAIACLDCSMTDHIPHNLLESVVLKEINGIDNCCAYNNKELTALLEISMRGKHVKSALPAFNVSNFSLSSASAHVQLLAPIKGSTRSSIEFTDELATMLLKDVSKHDKKFEHVRKVDLLKDGFKVIHSGVYYLYSSVHFKIGSEIKCSTLSYTTWHHTIEKKSSSQSMVLFKSAYTCCNNCTSNDETSYTGGAIRLLPGDVINIKISGYGLAFIDRNSTFAGLMMMGES
ncbi:tumor necrosis factor ligand superfamily member 10 [Biomphalaria glabrata]